MYLFIYLPTFRLKEKLKLKLQTSNNFVLTNHGQLYQNAKRLLWPPHSLISP
jgi:hypothetical protein